MIPAHMAVCIATPCSIETWLWNATRRMIPQANFCFPLAITYLKQMKGWNCNRSFQHHKPGIGSPQQVRVVGQNPLAPQQDSKACLKYNFRISRYMLSFDR